MYYELIHTRCRYGYEILKNGSFIDSGETGGFKTYDFACEIIDNNINDLFFIEKIQRTKQSFSDDDLMDDAYLYFTPDVGLNCLMNFHPIHFDENFMEGNYPHRKGNFINQLFLGEYSDFYPYETFGNKQVWNAQLKHEKYYYENYPEKLEPRETLVDSVGYIGLEEVSDFILEGRQDALKCAVAYIISQFSISAEDRKFLVICDENSRNIELWIAAIESAFSPRMSSGLSFATRFDDFISKNKYTVDLNGRFQTQIDLRSPMQKLRYYAMIVGVDARDRDNFSKAKPMLNSSFIVLNGFDKILSEGVDTDNPYYQCIASFDENHNYFCREFLQSIDIVEPSIEILELYKSYEHLTQYENTGDVDELLNGVSILSKYSIRNSQYINRLYQNVKKKLSIFFEKDIKAFFFVVNWLEKTSKIVNDTEIKNNLIRIVCRVFSEKVYKEPSDKSTQDLWTILKTSDFLEDAVVYLANRKTIDKYFSDIQLYDINNWLSFFDLFINATNQVDVDFQDSKKRLLSECLHKLFKLQSVDEAMRIIAVYSNNNPTQTVYELLEEAQGSPIEAYSTYIIHLVVRIYPELISTEKNLENFIRILFEKKLSNCVVVALNYKAQLINEQKEIDEYLHWIIKNNRIDSFNLSTVFEILDSKLDYNKKGQIKTAVIIQKNKPINLMCPISASIYLLDLLEKNRDLTNESDLIEDLIEQGLPSIHEHNYIHRLCKRTLECRVSRDSFIIMIQTISRSADYSDELITEAARSIGNRKNSMFGSLIDVASSIDSNIMFNSFVKVCASFRQFEKNMDLIKQSVRTNNGRQYLLLIKKESQIQRKNNKGDSIFKKLFYRDPS